MAIYRRDVLEKIGKGADPKEYMGKGIGTTTTAILAAVVDAINNPGEKQVIEDRSSDMKQLEHAKTLHHAAAKLVNQLQLKDVTVVLQRYEMVKAWQVTVKSEFCVRL